MRSTRVLTTGALAVLLPFATVSAEWNSRFDFEGRLFTQEALATGLERSNLSVAFEPEYYKEWQRGTHTLTTVAFARLDQNDPERTHWDIRELTWQYNADDWELRTGVRRVFWSVTESKHVVDIINQTDLTENIDGEVKLGQPMVNFAWIQRWGTLDVFALFGFRERRFFGPDSRPGLPFPLDTGDAVVEDRPVDLAVRWSHAIGFWDIGISHFHGTSRDPRFAPKPVEDELVLVPVYDRIHQTGVDLQLTQGGWLWKLEGINRFGQGPRFAAITGGFEYTFVNVSGSGLDLGLLAEYSWDERRDAALTPLQDDVFVGARFAFNDVQATEILAGAAIDRVTASTFVNVEASRRMGESWTLDVQLRAFQGVPPGDRFLFGIKNDHYLQLKWSWHF